MTRSLLLGGVTALAMTGAAQAAIVTLDLSTVTSGGPVVNGALISDSFGDTSLVDFTWSAGPSGSARFWNAEYSDDDAAWCGRDATAVCSFTIANISPNHRVRLLSVTLGSYESAARTTDYQYTNSLGTIGGGIGLPVGGVPGATVTIIFPQYVLQGGSHTFQWGPDGTKIGVTSVTYEYERLQGNEVSEPATLALLGAGLIALAAVRRRRA